MPKTIRKADLAQGTCMTCGRPFAWRKVWAAVRDQVRYGPDRCCRQRRSRP